MRNWLLVAIVILISGISITYAQDGNFIYRDNDGKEVKMTQVVTSEQMKTVIANQEDIKSSLAAMQTQIEVLLGNVPDEPVELVEIYINTATLDELQQVPGIGAVKAGAIVAERGTPDLIGYNPFTSWTNLTTRVRGVGPATVADMQAAGILLDESTEE